MATSHSSNPQIPNIVSTQASRVRYPTPKIYWIGREKRQASEAIEIVVKTATPIEATAVTPVLYVGRTPVATYQTVGDRTYRFVAYQPESIQEGASLALGWPGRAPRAVATALRLMIGPSKIA